MKKNGIIIISFIVLLIIQFAIIGVLMNKIIGLESEINTINNRLSQQDSILTNSLQNQNSDNLKDADKLKAQIDFINLCNRLSSNTIATDKFYIHRFVLIGEDTIEVGFLPQPNRDDIVEKGKFKLTDRELKASLIELLSRVNEKYEEWGVTNKNLPKLSDYKIKLTNYNHYIATYDKGVLTLAGE